MTGEKIRTMRKDHNKTNKNDEILESYDETSNGSINQLKSNKAFQKSSALLQQQQQQLNANIINGNPSSIDTVVSDNNKNPIILTSDVFDFPVHECVFKGDVRRLSSLIRTHSISQKDVHGIPPSLTRRLYSRCALLSKVHSCCFIFIYLFIFAGNTPLHLAVMMGHKGEPLKFITSYNIVMFCQL